MNRRNFIKVLLAGAVAPAIVKAENIMRIEPLRFGRLEGFGFYESNKILTLDDVTREALRIAHRKLDFINGDVFTIEGIAHPGSPNELQRFLADKPIGETVRIRRPISYRGF